MTKGNKSRLSASDALHQTCGLSKHSRMRSRRRRAADRRGILWTCVEIKIRDAFVVLHAIDATPARHSGRSHTSSMIRALDDRLISTHRGTGAGHGT